jgi:DNA-binding response OmpR family regulator
MLEKKTILIVEDEPELSKALSDKLSEEGFSILEAKNGQEGLDIAKDKHPDLILLDILMPIMDGMTMLEMLREDESCKDIPVIFLTNLDDQEKVSEALKAGSFDYLIKTDWSLADIVKKIKNKLEKK